MLWRKSVLHVNVCCMSLSVSCQVSCQLDCILHKHVEYLVFLAMSCQICAGFWFMWFESESNLLSCTYASSKWQCACPTIFCISLQILIIDSKTSIADESHQHLERNDLTWICTYLDISCSWSGQPSSWHVCVLGAAASFRSSVAWVLHLGRAGLIICRFQLSSCTLASL